MNRTAVYASMTLLALVASTAAHACSPVPKPLIWIDKPIKVAPDCSYSRAEDDFYDNNTARAAVDIGNGKVGQRLVDFGACTPMNESLLVVDCNAKELIVIGGQPDPNSFSPGGQNATVDMLYSPHGRVRLTRDTSIDELAAVSEKAGYQYSTDTKALFETAKRKNRYNPYCGCGVFYPDSLGAKQ